MRRRRARTLDHTRLPTTIALQQQQRCFACITQQQRPLSSLRIPGSGKKATRKPQKYSADKLPHMLRWRHVGGESRHAATSRWAQNRGRLLCGYGIGVSFSRQFQSAECKTPDQSVQRMQRVGQQRVSLDATRQGREHVQNLES